MGIVTPSEISGTQYNNLISITGQSKEMVKGRKTILELDMNIQSKILSDLKADKEASK